MKKKILIILTCISILIIIFGIISEINIKNEVISETMPTDNMYIDGTNFTDISSASTAIGSNFLGTIVFVFSIVIVISIWIIYLLVYLVIEIVKKYKKSKENL